MPPADRIERALDLLVHRGPDRQATFESGLISLGAARLKILDLEAGDQPMLSGDGDTVIAFNGEIYNHLELRRELAALGYPFRTRTDTETVLNAFLAWDTDCFSRLRGMFAVALWTESEKRLVLARDRMGIKPLYVAQKSGNLFFASELKAILIHPEIDRELCRPGLDCYLSLNYVPAPWTLIEAIRKLQPGCWMEWRNGETSSAPYWTLPSGAQRNWSLEAAKGELDRLLAQSMSEHLLSDVPVGVWLSGGLDSSTILHYAAQASSRRLKTFSLSFSGRSFDESSAIRNTAARYQTEHHELDLNPGVDLEAAVEEFAYYSDEPNADAGALPVWFLSKLMKGHATVALSGEGADELFGGYLTYRADRMSRLLRPFPKSALRLASGMLRHWPVSDEKISFEYKLKRFVEGSRMPEARAHVFWNGTFSEEEKRRLLRAQTDDELAGILSAPAMSGGGLSSHLWFDQAYYLPDNILTKVDRMSMAHSIEVRPPFLDHRLVEFAASLPDKLKIAGSRQKVVLRSLMADRLPAQVLRGKKIGLDIPAHEWLRGPLQPLLMRALQDGRKDYPDFFNEAQIDLLLQQHLTRRANLGYHLWGLMILFLWMRKWRIQTAEAFLPDQQLAKSVSSFI